MKLVYSVGVNDKKYPAYIQKVCTREYRIWNGMIRRCYDVSFHERNRSYIGCTVSENFKSYSYFYEWCQEQIGFENEAWQLDKDILVKGNKLYSENVCLFIPQELNCLLTTSRAARGEYPLGVTYDQKVGQFCAQGCFFEEPCRKHIGYYSTASQAFLAYKTLKESFIKQQAEKWKADIDPRAYHALMNYQVEITD